MIHVRSGLTASINLQASKKEEVAEEAPIDTNSETEEANTQELPAARATAYGDLSSEQYLANMGIKMVSVSKVNTTAGHMEIGDRQVEEQEEKLVPDKLNIDNSDLITKVDDNNKMPEEENQPNGKFKDWFRDKIARPIQGFVQKHKAIFKLGEDLLNACGFGAIATAIERGANAIASWLGI